MVEKKGKARECVLLFLPAKFKRCGPVPIGRLRPLVLSFHTAEMFHLERKHIPYHTHLTRRFRLNPRMNELMNE